MDSLVKTAKGKLLLRHLARCRKCFKEAKAQGLQTQSDIEAVVTANHPGETL